MQSSAERGMLMASATGLSCGKWSEKQRRVGGLKMPETIRRDYCVIGAGPAGLQLGYYLEQAGRSYVILERGDSPGTFFKQYPRHRQLISVNKVYTGHDDREINYRWDWNSLLCDDDRLMFKNYSKKYFPNADDLVRYLEDFANLQDLKVRCNVDVTSVNREGEQFVVTDSDGNQIVCRKLIVATGLAKPNIPSIPGIELVEQYADVSVDPGAFIDQRVLIIGKGNSAFETADNLIETTSLIHVASPHPVKFAWQTHFVGNLRAVNNNLLDTYLLKCQNATLEVEISKIEKVGEKFRVTIHYQRAAGSMEVIEYDRVICCTGFRMDTSIFDDSCAPETMICGRFPSLDSSWQSVNVPHLHFAGVLMQGRDYKKTTSAFIHGFRYNVRALAMMLLREEGCELPHESAETCASGLTELVLDGVNRSSALWQQFGFLADCLMVSKDGTRVDHYQGLPVSYVHDVLSQQYGDYYLVTLEYGFKPDDDPFRSERVAHTAVDAAEDSTFLHPIIRRFHQGCFLDEKHIVENLEANWSDDSLHRKPLKKYFEKTLVSQVLETVPAD